jgi:hypothetical protein
VEQARSKSSMSKRVVSGTLILFLLLILSPLLFPISGLKEDGYHFLSWSNMKHIALAVYQYQLVHDETAPQKLSQLVPNYANSEMFFLQSKYNTSLCFVPTNAEAHPELIDKFSPYSFVVLPDKRILVWERPGMWIDNTMSYFVFPDDNQSTNIFQTSRSNRVTAEEFQRRLSRSFH